jgi:galactose oxidase
LQIRISTDGRVFGNGRNPGPVVAGAFTNSAAAQTARFTAIAATHVSVTILSEVNGGPWSSAAEVNVLGPGGGGGANVKGQWGGLIRLPLVPASAALLPDGRVRLR